MRVATWLRQQGFSLAQSMAGGIDRWAEEIDRTLARY
jgi:rhodanese-related sulfurtransferase